MKKIVVVFSSLILILSMATYVFAGTSNNEGGDEGKPFTVDDGKNPATSLSFNFSPNVAGQYTTTEDSGNEQWFSIGTYHVGGTLFYATSSDQTIIWKKSRSSGDLFATASIPGAPPTNTENVVIPWDEADADWKK